MRCLWLARTLPYPLSSGDRVYTANLAAALAFKGVKIRFVGLDGGAQPPSVSNIEWVTIPGKPRRQFAAVWSLLPLVAARHRIPAYVDDVARHLARPHDWDVVVLDQYGMGWALDLLTPSQHPAPVVVFVAHDHEESVMRSLWQKSSMVPHRKAFLFVNYLKTRALERRTVAGSDLVTAITPADAVLFRAHAKRALSLEPGYSGASAATRTVDRSVPRRILLFGSFAWSAKQENLRMFLNAADAAFAAYNIEIEIVGQVPEAFASEISARYKSVRLAGFVADPAPHFANARLAALAEAIGGGFKMKILDYVFNRVPVLALEECLSGLPDAVRRRMFSARDLPALVNQAIALIDDVDALDRAQEAAYVAARSLFDWSDRGEALLAGIQEVARAKQDERARRAPSVRQSGETADAS